MTKPIRPPEIGITPVAMFSAFFRKLPKSCLPVLPAFPAWQTDPGGPRLGFPSSLIHFDSASYFFRQADDSKERFFCSEREMPIPPKIWCTTVRFPQDFDNNFFLFLLSKSLRFHKVQLQQHWIPAPPD